MEEKGENMKKSYKFGEILLYLREEYKQCKYLFDKLNKCISIENSDNFYFTGSLSEENRKIKLVVEKKYSEILKTIAHLKYDWYSVFLYTAYLDVIKGEDNIYQIVQDSTLCRVPNNKIFKPLVDVLYQDEFDNVVKKILSLDMMKRKKANLYINHDVIALDFGRIFISSKLGYESLLHWDGNCDTIDYLVRKDCSPYLLKRILYLELPMEYIPKEWLQIFEKHESEFSDEIYFDVDVNIQNRKGNLQIETSNNRNIKLLRKKYNASSWK